MSASAKLLPRDVSPAEPNGRLRVLEGREFVFSPPWHDDRASVLFDGNSGDYWLLSPLAREIVRDAVLAGPQDSASLIRRIASQTGSIADFDGDEETIRRVIHELVQQSILAQT